MGEIRVTKFMPLFILSGLIPKLTRYCLLSWESQYYHVAQHHIVAARVF